MTRKLFPLLLFLSVTIGMSSQSIPDPQSTAVELSPLKFYLGSSEVTDVNKKQQMWKDLMKYKLWATESVVFNKQNQIIREPAGYTGTARGKVILNNGHHTLGGPVISGGDLQISYPSMGADCDTILHGPVRAEWLVLPNWYNAQDASYAGIYSFEHRVFFDTPSQNDISECANVTNRFIDNIHKNGKAKIYADWDNNMDGMIGLPGLDLDGSFSQTPQDIPQPDYDLSVPVLETEGINWEPAINVTSSAQGEFQFIHVPPITSQDIRANRLFYDKFLEGIRFSGGKGKRLYILMPTNYHNANRMNGRLTRIFCKDGIITDKTADDTGIQVAYVNREAQWDDGSNAWTGLDPAKMTIVKDEDYTGNLLFYSIADIIWPDMNENMEAAFQGTYMTPGNITVQDSINITGQLIAGRKLLFDNSYEGRFNYVPFNPPMISADILTSDIFKESGKWIEVPIYLTDTAVTDVSFDYTFEFLDDIPQSDPRYDRIARTMMGRSFATRDDLGENDDKHTMQFSKDGTMGHAVIRKGTRTVDSLYTIYINIRQNDGVEEDEYMFFRISNLHGAVISGRSSDESLLLKIIDSDNQPPYFIDPDKTKLTVKENATNVKAGIIRATDDEGDSFTFDITGGSAQDMFDIGMASGNVTMRNGIEPFDYEEWKESGCPEYTIVVEVCDARASSFTPLLGNRATFTITVADANESPYFTDDNDTINIAENEQFAHSAVSFSDYDIYNTDGKLTNNEVIATDGDTAVFGVTKQGLLFVKPDADIDYEAKNTYTIELRVRDACTDTHGDLIYPDLYSDKTYVINVTKADMTAVEPQQSDEEIKVYPADGLKLYIQAPKGTEYSIYDIIGHRIAEATMKTDVEVIRLPQTGGYVVRVGTKTKKVMIK